MQKPVHIVVNKHTPFAVQLFERIGNVTALDTKEITKETVKDADILIVRSETKVNRELLEGSKVKFVGTVTIGIDHIDVDYLKEKGIHFVSAPGSNANSVGEYVISALLELANLKHLSLTNKTIGIVGVGNVGSNVWRKAEALGMKVLLNDPPLEMQGCNYPLIPLEDLMRADIISLHVPLTRSGPYATYHFFDEKRIGQMKPGSILINTSRGPVVETNALKEALIHRHLSGAVLDVWENEPRIDTELLDLASIGTPHIAGYSLDGKINALWMNYKAVCKFLSLPIDKSIESIIPSPSLPEINIERIDSLEETLREIVKKCYDIIFDDRNLRKIIMLPKEQQADYFSSLRANYRIRREFFNTTINIPKREAVFGRILESLGFKINFY